MTAYQTGVQHGKVGCRLVRSRMYETDKANNDYWNGYIDGMKQGNPGKRIVQCNREGRIFATDNVEDCTCPTCGRRYINRQCDKQLIVIS